ncbi:Lipoprotein [Candidatus Electronema halotolerans]
MRLKFLFFLLSGWVFLMPNLAGAQQVSVDIVSDRGWTFPAYPASSNDGSTRAYLEAKKNARYGIRIRNNTSRRVGVLVAVDGRNIISGSKSYLRSSEQMYLLNPYEERTYEGWRTGRDRINRFYFTEEGDSYAGAWDDYSAMGVIAVAVFPEKMPPPVYDRYSSAPGGGRDSSRRSYSRNAPAAAAMEAAPGTGYGEEEHSSSERVYDFKPQPHPAEKYLFKYEWRETLCRKHIISCRPEPPPRDGNRIWHDDDGYAPPPPPRRDREYWRR